MDWILQVTGSRKDVPYSVCETEWFTLATVMGLPKKVHSGMAKCVDTYACNWAKEYGIEVVPFPADWDEYGRAAGPIRNKAMVLTCLDMQQEGYRIIVSGIITPHSRGTRDMLCVSAANGLECHVVCYNPLTKEQEAFIVDPDGGNAKSMMVDLLNKFDRKSLNGNR